MSPEKLADGHGIATCFITWKQGCLEKLPLSRACSIFPIKPSNMSLIMKIYKVGLPFIGMSSLMLLMSPLANAAEMSHMDHSSMDMSGMDMSDMDHSSMDMSGNMSDMDHSSMDMSGDMSDMDHSGMDMSGDMSDMDHSGMDMSGDMSDMDHSGMDMSGDMSDMDHSGMDMSGDMSGMDHSGMDMSEMDMSGMQGGEAPADARSSDYSNGVPYGKYGKPIMMGSLPLWGVSVDDLGYQFDDDQINYLIRGTVQTATA